MSVSDDQPVAWANYRNDGVMVGLSEAKPDNWLNEPTPLYLNPPAGNANCSKEALEAAYDFLGGIDGATEIRQKIQAALNP